MEIQYLEHSTFAVHIPLKLDGGIIVPFILRLAFP
jgi:hypothetical protein